MRWPRFASAAGVILMAASLVYVLIGMPRGFAGAVALAGFFLVGFDLGSSLLAGGSRTSREARR